eukprot:gnl/MRDRNA2_/MRDRNA2_82837_c0_seq1.p1 gnl/MRDRNA2_/MRDRNA2_82837_c0~~gnl/MRDRNA2_/MRDRNA2_82837_c0_seq1.p1  ORF type:complete len:865 (-),score=139.24 gnl/MRDRNA2_/MRDRNA2_82837_c0_seq1:21-2615(-)
MAGTDTKTLTTADSIFEDKAKDAINVKENEKDKDKEKDGVEKIQKRTHSLQEVPRPCVSGSRPARRPAQQVQPATPKSAMPDANPQGLPALAEEPHTESRPRLISENSAADMSMSTDALDKSAESANVRHTSAKRAARKPRKNSQTSERKTSFNMDDELLCDRSPSVNIEAMKPEELRRFSGDIDRKNKALIQQVVHFRASERTLRNRCGQLQSHLKAHKTIDARLESEEVNSLKKKVDYLEECRRKEQSTNALLRQRIGALLRARGLRDGDHRCGLPGPYYAVTPPKERPCGIDEGFSTGGPEKVGPGKDGRSQSPRIRAPGTPPSGRPSPMTALLPALMQIGGDAQLTPKQRQSLVDNVRNTFSDLFRELSLLREESQRQQAIRSMPEDSALTINSLGGVRLGTDSGLCSPRLDESSTSNAQHTSLEDMMRKVEQRVLFLQNLMKPVISDDLDRITPVKDSPSQGIGHHEGHSDSKRRGGTSLQSIVDSPASEVASDTQNSIGNTSMNNTSLGAIQERAVFHKLEHATALARSHTQELAQMDELKQKLEEYMRENLDLKARLEELESLRRENRELSKRPDSPSARMKNVVEENKFLRALISNLRAEIQSVRSAFVRQTQGGKDSRRHSHSRANHTPRPASCADSADDLADEDDDDEAIEAPLEGTSAIAPALRAWAWGGAQLPPHGGSAGDEKSAAGSEKGPSRAQSLSAFADSNVDSTDFPRTGSRSDLGCQKTPQQQGTAPGAKVMARPLPLWKTSHHATKRELSPMWSSRSAPPRSLSRHASPQQTPFASPVSSRHPSRPPSRAASRSPSPQSVQVVSCRRPSVMVKVSDLPSQRSPEGKEIRREHWRMYPAQRMASRR